MLFYTVVGIETGASLKYYDFNWVLKLNYCNGCVTFISGNNVFFVLLQVGIHFLFKSPSLNISIPITFKLISAKTPYYPYETKQCSPWFWNHPLIKSKCPPGWGSLESESVKYRHESRGTRTWEWPRCEAQQQLYARDSSSCQRGCYIRTTTASAQLGKNYWSWVSRGLPPRRADWR
jgi:hypothetical protein